MAASAHHMSKPALKQFPSNCADYWVMGGGVNYFCFVLKSIGTTQSCSAYGTCLPGTQISASLEDWHDPASLSSGVSEGRGCPAGLDLKHRPCEAQASFGFTVLLS